MRALRREYDGARRDEGATVWDSPDVISYNGWLHRVWEECVYGDTAGDTPYLLDSAQEQALWEDAIKKSGVSGPLLNIPETARAAAGARDLLIQWHAPTDAAHFQGLEDTEAFWEWLTLVERRLKENDWITAAQLPGAIEQRIDGMRNQSFGDPITLAGFDELTPAGRSLFDALRRAECVVNETFGEETSEREPAASGHGSPRRVECHSAADEFRAAAAWARVKLEANPNARIGVVVRGLAASSAAVERIFDDTLHAELSFRISSRRPAFQLSPGTRAADAPVISTALTLLKLVTGMPLAEAGQLFRSPFIGPDAAAGARLESELRRFGCETVSINVDRVRRFFPKLTAAADSRAERKRPGQWSAIFSKLLVAAGWPGRRKLSPVERQALDQWDEALSELARLDVVISRMTLDAALARLRGIVSTRHLAPVDDAAPVQVMDVPDAAGSRFDALWIAGLHAAAWPQPPRPNPFLPPLLQRSAGIPHAWADWELGYARRATRRLLASSPEVVCSYPRNSGEEPLRPSPLIEAFPLSDAAPVFSGTALDRTFASAVPLERQPSGHAPELPVGTLQLGGTSLIADQSACPFRAFAKYRLGAREMDEAPLGISPAEHGNVAHSALETFWREMESRDELLARSGEEIRDAIGRAVNAALDIRLSRREKNASLERFRAFEEVRLARLIEEWLEVEKGRKPFKVVQHETGETVEIGGIQLKVRVDRIDRYEDGTHAILDYKTGASISKDGWDGERPDAPQLPVYAVVETLREISEIAFAQIAPGKMRLIHESGGELRRRIPEWRTVLTGLATRFREGDAEVDPKDPPKTCEFCKLQPLCRVNERLGTPLSDEVDS